MRIKMAETLKSYSQLENKSPLSNGAKLLKGLCMS